MANFLGFSRQWIHFIPVTLAGFYGKFLNDLEKTRAIGYRDKSALFGGHVSEGEEPSWPGALFTARYKLPEGQAAAKN